ncbi:xanthine dehydrogenase/oxidase-like [Amphiura filiformis]|uniref:xanthine dehydrogenase/oxidase-like n=1 Tax=Amphiura filiformis TaxID=82378 RepID=UPI003B21C183
MAEENQSVGLVFFCNGQKIVENHVDTEMSLAVYLRSKLRMTGCKIGCGTGACGACTVMVSSVDADTKKISHIAINACLYPVCAVHGKAVTTVEGIGSTETKLHAIQERLAKAHGSQCGFCSPGMVMSMYTLLRNNPKPTSDEILHNMEGNLCRCTGYRPILDAFNTFTEDGCAMGEECCRNRKPSDVPVENVCTELYRTSDLMDCKYDPSQDVIFPPELMTSVEQFQKTVEFRSERQTWISVSNLNELLQLKAKYPTAHIIAGNTNLGVTKDFRPHQDVVLHTSNIKELQVMETNDLGLKVGAMVTMDQLQIFVKTQIASLTEPQTRILAAIDTMLNRYAGQQIRNVATLGGHIMIGATDISAILLAVGCHVTVAKAGGKERQIALDQTFHQKTVASAIDPEEVLISVEIPYSTQDQYVTAYKLTPRRQQSDSAILNAVYNVTFEGNSVVVKTATFVYIGLCAKNVPVFAKNTTMKTADKEWDNALLENTTSSLAEELTSDLNITNSPSDKYTHSLVVASFFKFYIEVLKQLKERGIHCHNLPTSVGSIVSEFPRTTPCGTAVFEPFSENQAPLGRPIVHRSALQQASGEAVYTDDMPKVEGELHVALVLTTRGRAKVLSVDTNEALAIEGVVAYVSAADVPGNNVTSDGEEVFVTEQVYSVGQIHGAIVAATPEIAQQAAKKVKVQYEDLPAIVTIEDAMQQNSSYGPGKFLHKGDPEGAFNECPIVFEGSLRTHSQEHFYLEPSACVMRPSGEVGEIDVYVGFQYIKRIQEEMAGTLGIEQNKITCHTKRIGGGFGGKSCRFLHYLACAVAVKKTRRSLRMCLNRSEDMRLTGHRESNLAQYKVGCDDTGKIKALDLTVNSNCGIPDSVASGLLAELLFILDNVYSIDNMRVKGIMYKTNLPAISPMRAFASIENMYLIESIVSDVAVKCGLPQVQVRETNMHTEDIPLTYFGLPIEDFDNFRTCWQECKERSEYVVRRREVDAYNSQNRWRKRGLAIHPLKFNTGAYPIHFHQAGALVNAYIDGSILIHIGGAECGQGLFTKMIQIASRVLGVSVDHIHIKETNTDITPNPTDTAASSTSDIFGMAVKEACKILIERLKPYKDAKPEGTFADWVSIYTQATLFYRDSAKGMNRCNASL